MKNNWVEVFSGKRFYPLNPREEDITLEDIAHALSLTCRYGGHSSVFYSVAQHSISVYKELKERGHNIKVQLYGLLHDASEAYICDIPKPIKPMITNYFAIEKSIQEVIYKKYVNDLPNDTEQTLIDSFDFLMLATEAAILMKNSNEWDLPISPFKLKDIFKPAHEVEQEFLLIARALLRDLKATQVQSA